MVCYKCFQTHPEKRKSWASTLLSPTTRAERAPDIVGVLVSCLCSPLCHLFKLPIIIFLSVAVCIFSSSRPAGLIVRFVCSKTRRCLLPTMRVGVLLLEDEKLGSVYAWRRIIGRIGLANRDSVVFFRQTRIDFLIVSALAGEELAFRYVLQNSWYKTLNG